MYVRVYKSMYKYVQKGSMLKFLFQNLTTLKI